MQHWSWMGSVCLQGNSHLVIGWFGMVDVLLGHLHSSSSAQPSMVGSLCWVSHAHRQKWQYICIHSGRPLIDYFFSFSAADGPFTMYVGALPTALFLSLSENAFLSKFLQRQWGLFTKWRRSGSAGHFCTRVHAGCMAGCVRPRKTHLRRATFCSFCLNTLRVILTDDLCVRRTWKIKPEKELEQDFSIFISDRWQWAVWDSEQRKQHCRVVWTVTLTAVVGGKRHLRLGFVFYTEKSSTPSVLAVLVLCLRALAFVTVSAQPPRVCQIWRTRYGTCVQEPSTSETAADVQLSIARLSNLTKRKSSWRLKTHRNTCDCSVKPSSKSVPFFFRNTCVRFLSTVTVTGCRQTQVLRPAGGVKHSDSDLVETRVLSAKKALRWIEGSILSNSRKF